jgi:hypothetical protein
MATTREISANEVYMIADDSSNGSDVRTLFCFRPQRGTAYQLDKMDLVQNVKAQSGTPPQLVYEGTIATNVSFNTTTHYLKKSSAITTYGGVVSGTNSSDQAVSFKVDHILWIENDPNSGNIAYGVALVEEQ